MRRRGVYYNEHEPYAVAWLRTLIAAGQIAPGDVDVRDIQDVTPDDLAGYTQCHFFAGLGGWSYALRLAGWPDDRPVWTGSCPCQPLSSAGQRKGAADERHVWPAFFELIAECHPPTAFGEQVSSRVGREWMSGVRLDLESVAYAVGGADLPAASVGAPHIRQRLWWVAERVGVSDRPGRRARGVATEAARHGDPAESTSRAGGLADAETARSPHRGARPVQPEPGESGRADGGLADAECAERGPVDHARRDERLDGVSPRQEGAGRTRSGGEDGGLADATSQRRWSGTNRRDGTEVVNGGGMGDAAPHGRVEERADAGGRCERSATQGREQRPGDDSSLDGLADAGCVSHERGLRPRKTSDSDRTVESEGDQRQRSGADPWRSSELIPCADGRARRIPQSGIFPLAHGVPGRVGKLRAYGNAICPQVAAVFIRAYRESVTTWR